MKLRKLLTWACAILIALTPFPAFSESHAELADGIFDALRGEKSMQEWIDEDLSEGAGGHTDNYIFPLVRRQNLSGEEFSFTRYAEALYRALKEDDFDSPVSKQKSALALIAVGGGAALPENIADDTIGKLGVMSYVFGLHLLRSGAPSELWTEEALIEKILSLQKADGGWAITGNFGDPDVTAMCLLTLSRLEGDENMDGVIAAGLDFLSERQRENGTYASYGLENCESCAQVLIALDALGVNYLNDERFIRGGVNVLDAMLSFRMDDGLYEHAAGTGTSDMARVQALTALTMLDSEEYLYDFSGRAEIEFNTDVKSETGARMYILIAIAVLALGGVVFALTRRRGRVKQLIFVLLIAGAAIAATLLIDVQSAGDYYGGEGRKLESVDGYVTISIGCDTVAGRRDDGTTPEDGVILYDTKLPFQEGDSVFDILTDAVRIGNIQMEYSGTSRKLAYVRGINNLYEYDHGELSGWMYSVDGEFLSLGSGSYIVEDGDVIRWQYTTELGEDLK